MSGSIASVLRSPVYSGLLCFFCLIGKGVALDDEQAQKIYAKAQKELSQGYVDDALDRFVVLIKKHPRSELSALSLWEVYRIHIHNDQPEQAFEALDRLVTEQPGHFEKAHAAQLQLVQRLLGSGKDAKRTLEAVKKKTLIPPEIMDEMLKRIIRNGPQSEVGIQAQYYLAVALEKKGEETEAIAAHEDFAETYPQHELADDAGYQAAYIAYKKWKTMRSTGPKQREHAAVALAWFVARFPESDKAAQAHSCLAEVRKSELNELLSLARYYEGRNNPKAAQIYYKQVTERFPDIILKDENLREKILNTADQNEPIGPAE